jgi:DNA repair protein RadC
MFTANRSPPRILKEADVISAPAASARRDPLRTPAGAYLPVLYTNESAELQLADPRTIIESAEALLAARFCRGVRILKDPHLLLRFLRLRLVSQPTAVFAVFYLDRRQRLIRFDELFRGTTDYVTVHPREVIRCTLDCCAEQILCVRSDPTGNSEPTPFDVEDARRLHWLLQGLEIPLVDYVIVGEAVTSLRQRRVF